MTLDNKDKQPENEKKDVGGTLNLPEDYSDAAEQLPLEQLPVESSSPSVVPPLKNVSTPVPAGSDLTNSCTVEMDGEISALPKIVRTIDSRTINMDELAEEERSVWENFAGDENAQTLESHYPIEDSGTGDDGTAPPVGVESNLLLISRKLMLNPESRENQPDVSPDYQIERTLGRGGMGVVYAARQASLDRVVAIKVIQSVTDAEKSHFQSSGRFHAAQKQRREQFLSEAVVTGDLDHPNIVPIHDVAKTHEGDLFYSMKKVDGTPWDAVINTKSIEDNLEILLKVADAVGFAHSRGVVHRDLKPENVMLGEFGVVMVMDWGLAVPTPTFQKIGTIRQTTSLGGSPAYMAPELALGPIDQITPSSDIYLLGAILFQIVSGIPPHNGSGISQCLRAAAENRIETVPAEKQGELYHIALKAMATKQKDRYHTVQQFQDAIRNYRSHSESINLSERAAEDVVRAQETGDYADYARAVFGYEEALELWKHNASARDGVVQARLAYADAAYQKEDYDLGLSLLNDQQSDYQPMVARLRKGQRERNQRRSRLVAFRRVAVALLAVIFLGGSALSWQIYQEKQKVEVANKELETAHGTIKVVNKKIEDKQEDVAKLEVEVAEKEKAAEVANLKAAQAAKDADEKIKIADASIKASADKVKMAEADVKKAEADIKTAELAKAKADQLAKQAQAEADKAQADAVKALADAKQAQEDADKAVAVAKEAEKAAAKAQAEEAYVSYTSSISQARNYIDQNQHSQAIQILKQIRESRPADQPLGWEWNRLWFEANRARVEPSSEGTPVDGRQVRFGTSGQRALAIYDNGGLELISVQANGRNQHRAVKTGVPAVAAAFSPNERRVAVAGADGIVRLVDQESAQVVGQLQRLDLNGGKAPRVNAVQFLNDDLLLTASQDATIRLWNVADQKELGVCWNLAPVLDLDVAPASAGGSSIIAAAVSDLRNGRVVVWRVNPNAEKEKFIRETDFLSHTAPVLTVAFDRTGQRVASGDQSGKILIWDWKQIGQLNYRDKIAQAVAGLRNNSNASQNSRSAQDDATVYSFSDPDLQGAVNSTRSTDNLRVAHRDAVQQVRFSPDGRHLVSASSDLTLKVWGLTNGRLVQTLRGQGGPVRSVDFSPTQPNSLMSAGSGGLVSWDLKRASEVAVYRDDSGSSESQFTAHRDEILSAAFDRSGTRIVTSSRDHTARVLEIDPKTLEFKLIAKLRDEAPESDNGVHAGVLREGGEFVSLSMQVTGDNSRLFVGGADGVIRIWNVTQGAEIGAISGTGLNSSFAISKDGRQVVSGSVDPEAKALVWSVNEEGQPAKTPRWKLKGHKDTVTAFAISPDGRMLFTGDRRGTGFLWNAETGEQIGEPLQQHIGSRLNAAVFSPDGQELIVASDDRTASRVNTSNGQVIEKLQHDGFVTDLSLSPDGRQLFTISEIPENNDTKTRLQLWNLGDGVASTPVTVDQGAVRRRQTGEPLEQQRQIRSVRFGENSSTALSVQFDPLTRKSELKIWELNSNAAPQLARGLVFPGKIADTELVLPGPAGQIFTLNGDAVFLWDLKQLGHLRSYRPHAAVTQASFSADGKFVATSSKTVKIWNVETEKSLFQLEYPHNGAVRSVAFSPVPGSYQLLTGGDDGNVKLWNWDPQSTTVKEVQTFTGQGAPVRRVSFSADGELVLGVGDNGFAKIWKATEPQTAISLTLPEQPAGTLATNYLGGAISPDKYWVVASGQDRTIRLWKIAEDLKSAKLVREFSGHADEVTDVKFLAADHEAQFRIITASRDASVRVWDPRIDNLEDNVTPRELLALRRHSLGVTAVDATANNDLLLSAGLDGEVILWPTQIQP